MSRKPIVRPAKSPLQLRLDAIARDDRKTISRLFRNWQKYYLFPAPTRRHLVPRELPTHLYDPFFSEWNFTEPHYGSLLPSQRFYLSTRGRGEEKGDYRG